jgi:hypothetical protein
MWSMIKAKKVLFFPEWSAAAKGLLRIVENLIIPFGDKN